MIYGILFIEKFVFVLFLFMLVIFKLECFVSYFLISCINIFLLVYNCDV